MADRMVRDAHSIHGTNLQDLVEKIICMRIYESKYWKEECFGLTAKLVVDKAMELNLLYCVIWFVPVFPSFMVSSQVVSPSLIVNPMPTLPKSLEISLSIPISPP
uniref:Pre-mRNA-splicing factor 38B n=1 Tax=Taeniopygia guttata TaxID=59729 RepID=A0A674GUS8_TAEGU